jgi:serine/threonine protein phosphatase PrpC
MIVKQELSENLAFLGISAKGEAHLKIDKPNQDAIGFNSIDGAFVIAVSDGLGSCNNSQIGAQKAVSLCNDIFIEIIDKQISFKPENIVKRFLLLWNETFPGVVAKDYSATLKAVFLLNNELIAISAGDGLLLIRIDNTYHTLDKKEDEFINETVCLSYGMNPDIFKTIKIEKVNCVFVLICTDGVSNTISEGCEQKLTEEILSIKDINELRAEIEKMLIEMSRYNSDDKTIGLVKYG